MRILFSFIGGTGHFLPLVPVARAAVRAGHTVAFAGAGGQQQVILDEGFDAYATSDPPSPRGPGRIRDPAAVEPVDLRAAEQEFAENFASRGAHRHASVLPEIIDAVRPDLLVCDEADLGAAIAAEARGLPCATVQVLAAGTLIRPELVEPRLREVRRRHGLSADPALRRPELVLSPFPSMLRAPEARSGEADIAYRTGPVTGPREPSARPSVFVTLGTVFGTESGDLLERLLAGLAGIRAEVLLAVGRHIDPADLGTQPDHVRIERYVDQEAVLAEADLVVSHGGSGTMLAALAHGLPQVLTPLGADQGHNALRAETLGFGSVVDAATASGDDLRRAVEEALAGEGLRARARELLDVINGLPDVDTTVPHLERLVARAY